MGTKLPKKWQTSFINYQRPETTKLLKSLYPTGQSVYIHAFCNLHAGGTERVHPGPVEPGGLVHQLLLHQLDCSQVGALQTFSSALNKVLPHQFDFGKKTTPLKRNWQWWHAYFHSDTDHYKKAFLRSIKLNYWFNFKEYLSFYHFLSIETVTFIFMLFFINSVRFLN